MGNETTQGTGGNAREGGAEAFPIGTYRFHEDPNMNYQLNRVHSVCGGDLAELREVAGRIGTTEEWCAAFLGLAELALREGRRRNAAAYYRAANFYLPPGDPAKRSTYEAYVRLSMEPRKADLESGLLLSRLVPYGRGCLPALGMRARAGSTMPGAKPSTVLMHLGYDSLKEELLPVMELFSEAGMDIWLFEGPGQGEALYRYGLTMTHEWERPVKAVLDHLGLEDVTLVGLSLGGYLAPRAAAFEPRVKRVIAWGVLYDFFETVVSRRGKALELFLKAALRLRARGLLDAVVRRKMAADSYTRWGVEQGMSVFGARDPYEYFAALGLYSMKEVSRLVRQDFLLLGSSEDHFIPRGHFERQIAALGSARSLTARLFTAEEHAENHVQFGNIALATRCMIRWIEERMAS
jgi:pimeloyl-ACP methyl ester carboxylesterase